MQDTAASQPTELDRRSLLAAGAAGAGALALDVALPDQARATTNRYFEHGVASGDPYPDSVVLWTRVTAHCFGAAGFGQRPTGQCALAGRA